MVKISESKIPVPKVKQRYPWHTMKVGQSFLVRDDINFMVGNANARYAPKKFTSAREKRGTRVWRVE